MTPPPSRVPLPKGEDDLQVPAGVLVEVTKLRAAPEAAVEPGSWVDYPVGCGGADTSLPVDYVLVGILLEAPQVGRSVRVFRLQRNDVDCLGIFESTPVTHVTSEGFLTRNSVYRLRRLNSES